MHATASIEVTPAAEVPRSSFGYLLQPESDTKKEWHKNVKEGNLLNDMPMKQTNQY